MQKDERRRDALRFLQVRQRMAGLRAAEDAELACPRAGLIKHRNGSSETSKNNPQASGARSVNYVAWRGRRARIFAAGGGPARRPIARASQGRQPPRTRDGLPDRWDQKRMPVRADRISCPLPRGARRRRIVYLSARMALIVFSNSWACCRCATSAAAIILSSDALICATSCSTRAFRWLRVIVPC